MAEDMTRRKFVKLGVAAAGTVVVGGGAVKLMTAAPEVGHPSKTMGDGAMKALVVYGTKSGCTTGVAEAIGKTLAEAGATVDVVPGESAPDPAGYDMVYVGSGVRAGQWHTSVSGWVKTNAEALKAKPVAFYTVALTMADASKDEATRTSEVGAYTDPLIAETGVKPVDVGLFAGWFEPKRFSFIERTIMKLMKAPEGDHRDFSAIASWTTTTAEKLQA